MTEEFATLIIIALVLEPIFVPPLLQIISGQSDARKNMDDVNAVYFVSDFAFVCILDQRHASRHECKHAVETLSLPELLIIHHAKVLRK